MRRSKIHREAVERQASHGVAAAAARYWYLSLP
jgi:hypothetical protein